MKKPLSRGGSAPAPLAVLVLSVAFWAAACGNADPRVEALASSPDTSGSGTPSPVVAGPGSPEPGPVLGAPGEQIPVSTPPVNDGPGATETNFLTAPCNADGARQRPDAGGEPDAGDAGSAPSVVADAGSARCVAPSSP